MNVSQTVCILGDNKNLQNILENISKVENPDTKFITFDEKFNILLNEGKAAYLDGITDFDSIK